ncbi:hypothetical protein PCASD_04397 [Puccinia coronata f. sp. avenae]|uniref:Nuclear fusion protein KAR5 n=1 Tax=Puccinia coronata f. sp. avenae TaxID=200324 RepID=A0A2N5VBS1_9BASI|nr:hypothetical protein PCASD_04397 [Puccinia coronata f. sp. avenae]
MRMHWPRIPLRCLSLLLISGVVFGFRFGFQDSNSVAPQKKSDAISGSEARTTSSLISELEKQLQGLSIDHEREESSCYSNIFGSLTSQEKNATPEPSLCSVLGRSEAHRTAFAARLTICELESNRLTLPRECTLWIEAGSDPTSTQLQACVGALHASPQSWSSFTGHQREAVQLCFAHQKLQGIELATSLNLKTIKFSTDMIRLSRLDHQSNQEDLRKLRDHMRDLFDQSIQNFDSVSEKNHQEAERVFQELENRFQDVKNHLYERNEEMWREFNVQQNQQINSIQNTVQSLNNNHELQVKENVNNFLQSMKEEVEQKIQSSLDSAVVVMVNDLKQAFQVESRSNSAHLNHQIKQAFESALDLVTQRHHDALEENISLQSHRISSLFDELVSVENLIGSMKQNLDSIQVSSTDRESFLRESSDRIEEQKRKGEELISRFMESMEAHQAMIRNLSESVSNSPLFMSYSFFTRGDGWISGFFDFAFNKLSIYKIKIFLGWIFWFTWMSGGINWILKVGLFKTGSLLFFLTVRMPFTWLRHKTSSVNMEKEVKPILSKGESKSQHLPSTHNRSNDSYCSDAPVQLPELSRQIFVCSHSDHQVHVRRKFSSQSLGSNRSRIVPTRLIGGNQTDEGS